MQQVEFALSVIPTGCLSALVTKLPCNADVLRVLATLQVDHMM
jgi:hypothetical protein